MPQDRVRVQFPDEVGMIRSTPLEIDVDTPTNFAQKVDDRLREMAQEGEIRGRPRITGGEETRTTGGPALVVMYQGEVNLRMLQEMRRLARREVSAPVTEVLVL